MNDKLDKIISLLESINAALAIAGKPAASTQTSVPAPSQAQGEFEEKEFYICTEATIWKSGKGAFNRAKINHTDDGVFWSVGVGVDLLEQAVGNDWLRKGDVVCIFGKTTNELWNGIPRPTMFAKTLRLISRRADTPTPIPAATEPAQPLQDNTDGATAPTADDLPF